MVYERGNTGGRTFKKFIDVHSWYIDKKKYRGVTITKIKVTVERIDGYCNLPMLVGDYFYVEDSKLYIPEGKHICIWALQSMMPIFPILAERDKLEEGHWVKTVKYFSCPDPKGKVLYRLELVEK
ncbi:MAG: TIGR04076 family protein [Euryarchaeota archaeon]|nr:TIGR04076 family protein [Euryarchaeota archaeon]